MKRVLAMVLCLAMVLAMTSVAAFAADEVTIIGATVDDPGKDMQGKPEDMYDGSFGNAYVYGWNGVDTKRAAVFELEKAVTLEDCYLTWGHPSWAGWDMAAEDYTISVSSDGEEYTEIYKATGVAGVGKQRTDTIVFDTPAENVKFVKVTITKAVGEYLAISEVRFNKGNTSATTSSEAASSAAASSEATSSVAASSEAASSEAASSAATSSAATSSAVTSSEAVSSVAESSAATTDNEPKSMTWLWIVIAAAVVVVVVVIVLTSKKKK